MTNETENEAEIDTSNYGIVGKSGRGIQVMRPLVQITNEQALNVAAYLVLMAEDYDGTRFAKVLKAVGGA